jgi:hypothetical protein
VLEQVGGQKLLAKTIEQVVHDVGPELAERRDPDPKTDEALANRPESPPEMAVVECDGGRIRTREPGHGPGVHCDGEGWRESKNACLIRTLPTISSDDPQPEPPGCFTDPKHVAQLAETQALSVTSARVESPTIVSSEPELGGGVVNTDWCPKRVVRTVLSSISDSKTFGKQMESEAQRRRFGEAKIKAFLGRWSVRELVDTQVAFQRLYADPGFHSRA